MGFSLGGSFGKDRSKSKDSSTMTLDPALSGALYGNLARAQALADQPYAPYSGERVAGFNPDQLGAQQALRGIHDDQVGAALLGDAAAAARGLGAYEPGVVSAPRLADLDLSAYANPYEGQVVQNTLDDIGRQRQAAGLTDRAEAISAGAFGGTREAVQRALTAEAYDRNALQAVGALRQQGFQNAQQAAQADLARRLSADTANQAAGLQGAQVRAAASGLLGNLSQQQLEQAVTRAGLLGQVGDAGQALAQKQADAGYGDWQYANDRAVALQNLLNQTLGLLPTYGTTRNRGSNTKTSVSLNPGWQGS